tara:strand:+ start:2045 stop:2701 length:657 start_codon:yes stop_codon:yes gene_type:complete
MKEKIIKDNPETSKQWHRYYLNDAAKRIKENTNDGCFIECGVKQGTSSVIMAKTLSRPGILFDTWSGFPGFSKEDTPTKSTAKRVKKRCNRSSTKKDCIKNLKEHGIFELCKMVQGDILKTVPDFDKNGLSICMMHIDTDIYEPAKVSLNNFWDNIIDGGVVFVHDYRDKKWPGIQRAVDDFVNKILKSGGSIKLHEYPADRLKSCLLVKSDNLDISK